MVRNEIADCARDLRARYGNKNFPLLDAVVVAFGVIKECQVITCDAKWPDIDEAESLLLKLG